MKVRKVTPILNVSDVPASIAWFESLGWNCAFCWNSGGQISEPRSSNEYGPADFAGVCSDDAEIFLCKDGQGDRPGVIPKDACTDKSGGVWMSWWMDSATAVDELYALATQLGYSVATKPCDEPWGVHEFHLRHPDGHTVRVSAGIDEP